jgi:ABC-2 type transport system ATP-binding protein
MSPAPAIFVRGLRHEFGARVALDQVAFEVAAGEMFGLLGPNGGGKTTLFRVLATLLVPTSGEARVFGLDVVERPRAVRREIGVVFQSPSLDVKLTVAENLRHQGHLYALHGRDLATRLDELLDRLGLADRRNERVEKLSGGLRRRLELAKGLLHRPRLLLLDEPSAGLDAGARRDFRSYLRQLCQQDGVTVFLTTHLMDEAESCDRIGILDRGRLVALDTPEAMKSKIGGDVLVLEAAAPERLREQIEARFGGPVSVVDTSLRLERPQGHRLLAELMEAFPGQIRAVRLAQPTLEDVFVHETGHRFWDDSHISPVE